MGAVGVAESLALAGLGLTVLGFAGTTVASGVKALWAISRGLGTFEGKILEILARHENTLDDHEDRLRAGKL
jgi:hypothetical protein